MSSLGTDGNSTDAEHAPHDKLAVAVHVCDVGAPVVVPVDLHAALAGYRRPKRRRRALPAKAADGERRRSRRRVRAPANPVPRLHRRRAAAGAHGEGELSSSGSESAASMLDLFVAGSDTGDVDSAPATGSGGSNDGRDSDVDTRPHVMASATF